MFETTCFKELSEKPDNIFSETIKTVQLYHIRHSRERASIDGVVVKKPRHVIIYDASLGNGIYIYRIFHDSMDMPSQVQKLLE